jgi:hypothetical protein
MMLRPAGRAEHGPPALGALGGLKGDPVELFAAELVATGVELLTPAVGRSHRLGSSDGQDVR